MTTGADLTGRTVVVAGATGGIGEGAVRALLDQGATVLALSRSASRLAELAERIGDGHPGRLVPLECDVTAEDSAAVTAAVTEAVGGPVDGVLISIGASPRPTRGTVLDIPDEDVREMISVNEIGGWRALRALVPCVAPRGAVVNVMGYSGEIPFPHNPLMGSTNAALRSLVRTLAVQLSRGPRVYALVLGMVRTRARQSAGIDDPAWLTGEDIGAYTAALVRGDVERPEQTIRYLLDPRTGPTLTPPQA